MEPTRLPILRVWRCMEPVIPAEAVRAAFIAIYERDHIGGVGSADIRRALEAAAPHMLNNEGEK